MEIFKAINGVMEEIGAIGKTSENQQQHFMYRGIDAVMNALQPALIKHKVFVVPETLEQRREERTTGKGGNLIYSILKIKFTFYAEDGSNVSATVIGEGMDSGDKASNKAMSVAFKYACFQVLCIPTEEMKDPDAETPPPSKPDCLKTMEVLISVCRDMGIDPEAVAKAYGMSADSLTAEVIADAIQRKRRQIAGKARKEAAAVNTGAEADERSVTR